MEQAVAGADPHKLTVTLAVVDLLGVEVASGSFANTEAGLADALAWLKSLNVELVRVGVEGSSGHGRHLAGRLVDAGFDTREVPPRRTAERRRARRRAKSDHEDALAIARATAGEPDLGPVKPAPGSALCMTSSLLCAPIVTCSFPVAPCCSTRPRPRWSRCPRAR